MVVHEVRAQDVHQMSLVEHDDVIQRLSADRAYEPREGLNANSPRTGKAKPKTLGRVAVASAVWSFLSE